MAFFPKKGDRSTQSKVSPYSQLPNVISISTNNIDVLHTRKIMLHRLFSSFIMVWIMCSSTPLKKAISASVVSFGKGSSFTGTMVNLFVDIRMAPPLIDTFIVPKVPGVLYALFDYGLTFKRPRNCSFFSTFLASSSVIPIMRSMPS